MDKRSRREFIRFLLAGATSTALTSLLASCGVPEAIEEATPLATPKPAPTPTPLQILRNENPPDFYIRWYNPFPAPNPESWRLRVEGLVRNPLNLSLSDVQGLPSLSQVSRMKCVECWSARAKWEGFETQALMELVEPLPEAKWLHFYCADDYYESLPIEGLLQPRVLFVHGMNDLPLPAKHGSPLRLIFPSKYGYKGAKAIVRLEFSAQEKIGYWSEVGPYSTVGGILPGSDYPLEIGERRQIGGGEVIYPEDEEAQEE